MPNPQRFYRDVKSLEDAKTAIHELTDHAYNMREQLEGHKKTIAELHGKIKAQNGKKAFTGDIQGIKVKAVTDMLSLKNGWSLKYNAATGELEFAP